MSSGLYLGGLLLALGGLAAIDHHWRLVWWHDARRAARALEIGWLILVAWDALGIGLRIFYRGDSPYLTGIQLGPEFPLEEAFFLALLVYLPLILWQYLKRQHHA